MNHDLSGTDVWNFVSAPELNPMKVTINVNKPGTAPGYIFTAPYTAFEAQMIGQTGSLIMEKNGDPIWFRPLPSRYVQNTDFKVQCFKGEPVLTMWEGTISGTQSSDPNLPDGDPEPGAFFRILDQHYEIMTTITARKGFTSDVHEFTITKRNTALFTAVKQVPADLTPYGGPANGYIDNYSIQEVDIETGQLVFFWNVLDHIDPNDSIVPASTAVESNNIWDTYHVNSVEEGLDDTLLISMRNTWAIYNVDKKTGKIVWQLGGKRSDFTFAENARFSWQHDARYVSKNRISLFDDACCASETSPPEGPARGLILKLDFKRRTAAVDRTYYHDPTLFVPSQGNVQRLKNGNRFIGWGQEPYASEYRKAGNTLEDPSENFLYDMQFPGENLSYRTFKYEWVGLPNYPVSVAIKQRGKKTAVYVSWNGSTETSAYQVLAGKNKDQLFIINDCTPREGFETKINVSSSGPCFQVNALDNKGNVIGTSNVVCLRRKK